MKFTKEQLEALGKKIEDLENEVAPAVERAVKNGESIADDTSKKIKELAGLKETLRAAKALAGSDAGDSNDTRPQTQQQIAQRAAAAEAGNADDEQQRANRQWNQMQVTADPRDEKPFSTLGEQARAIMNAARGEYDDRLQKVHKIHEVKRAATGMGEAVPSDGGFLLQKEFSNQLQTSMYGGSQLLGLTTQLPLGAQSNGVKVLLLDETSRATGSRLGGVQVYWGNEADTVTATKPKMRLLEMELLKMFAAAYVTEELTQDSVALGSFLEQCYAEEMGFVIDDMIINADGAGRPAGILGAGNGCLVTVAAEGGQTAATFNFQNALKMRSRLPVRSRKNARWFINQEIETQLPQFTLLGGTSSPGIYIPGGRVVDDIPMDSLFGFPVQVLEQCAAVGTVGDVIFADMSKYITISKGGLQAASSVHVRFLQGENCFRFMQRWNGKPMNNSALTPYKGTATISPFVALAAR